MFRSLRRFLVGARSAKCRPVRKQSRKTRLGVEALETRMLMDHGGLHVPEFSSLEGAPATLYLDFDGHSADYWGDQFLGIPEFDDVETPAFDLDGDRTTFSADELDVIRQVWAGVAEDFAPFNINVTTVNPGSFNDRQALRVAIGGASSDWFDESTSGVAKRDSFTNGQLNLCFVFLDVTGPDPQAIATTVSHEAGHCFGLNHQRLYNADGTEADEYNPGTPGVWAPIMGDNLSLDRTTWHNGTVNAWRTDALPIPVEAVAFSDPWLTTRTTAGVIYVLQDDMAAIAREENGFGYRPDDHASNRSGATRLDRVGIDWQGSGIIGLTSDIDYFRITPTGSRLSARVNVAEFGPNLDARLELRDSAGTLIASADTTGDPDLRVNLEASLTADVVAGRVYYVVVGSSGSYGAVGQYIVTVAETGPRVVGVEPAASQIRVNFDKPVDPASFIPHSNVRIENANGVSRSVTITPVAGTNNRSFIVSFTASPTGGYRLKIGRTIRDLDGRQMDQNGDFKQGETVDIYSIEDFRGASASVDTLSWSRLRVGFSEEIDPATFTAADVTIGRLQNTFLGAPGSALPVVIRDIVPVSPLGTRGAGYTGGPTTTFEIVVENLPREGYRIWVGPDVRDRYGNPMNQDGNNVNGSFADRLTQTVVITPLMQRDFDMYRRIEAIDFERLARFDLVLSNRIPQRASARDAWFAGPQPEPPVRRDFLFAGPQPEPPGAPPSLTDRLSQPTSRWEEKVDRVLSESMLYDLDTGVYQFRERR